VKSAYAITVPVQKAPVAARNAASAAKSANAQAANAKQEPAFNQQF
jgi:hypothetical protein